MNIGSRTDTGYLGGPVVVWTCHAATQRSSRAPQRSSAEVQDELGGVAPATEVASLGSRLAGNMRGQEVFWEGTWKLLSASALGTKHGNIDQWKKCIAINTKPLDEPRWFLAQ